MITCYYLKCLLSWVWCRVWGRVPGQWRNVVVGCGQNPADGRTWGCSQWPEDREDGWTGHYALTNKTTQAFWKYVLMFVNCLFTSFTTSLLILTRLLRSISTVSLSAISHYQSRTSRISSTGCINRTYFNIVNHITTCFLVRVCQLALLLWQWQGGPM